MAEYSCELGAPRDLQPRDHERRCQVGL